MKILIFLLVLLVSTPIFSSSEKSYQAGNYIESIEKKVREINGEPLLVTCFFWEMPILGRRNKTVTAFIFKCTLSRSKGSRVVDNFKLTEEKLKK